MRLFRALAKAFPYEFRSAYGSDLLQVTEESIEALWRARGIPGLLRLLLDLALRIPAEYLSEMRQDVRFALRGLKASPGFTAVALISLSLGICIAICALSEMNAMVLRTLPDVVRPDELVALQSPVSYPSYRRYRELGDLWSSTLAYIAPAPLTVSTGTHHARTWGHLVTGSYFSASGVRPVLGRFFDPSDDTAGRAPGVVVSYRFWQEHLGGDPSIVGRTVRVNGQSAAVIGVAPQGFLGVSPLLLVADVWMPLAAGARLAPELAGKVLEQPGAAIFHMVGRLKAGVSMGVAESALDTVARQMERENGDANLQRRDRRITLVPGGKLLPIGKQDLPLFTSFLLIMAGLVMSIACANVANMMVARAATRRKEIAIRLSLGAGRWRLVRQLLTESMLLALGAGVLGVILSTWLLHLESQVRMPFPMPVAYDLQPDGRVLVLASLLTLVTGLAFGLAPALQVTRSDLTPSLKEGATVFLGSRRGFSLRNLLMVSQFAGSLTLLVIVGVMSIGIQSTLGIQQGFDARDLYLTCLDPVRDGFSPEQTQAFFERLLDDVKRRPQIKSATLTETVPVSLPGSSFTFSTAHSVYSAVRHVVGKGYFETTGIPILVGRGFRKEDEDGQATSIIVSEELVHQVWPGQDPLGRRIELGGDRIAAALVLPGSYDYRDRAERLAPQTLEVAGVAGNVAEGLLAGERHPAIYFPLRADRYAQPSLQGVTLIVRAVPGGNAIEAVERAVAAVDTRVTQFNSRSMTEQIAEFMAPLRMAAWTYALIGVFGLVLAAVGLAGVTAYSVTHRAHEIGIRMALGAQPSNILRLVMKEGVVLVAIGTGIGMVCASAGAHMLAAGSASVGRVTATSSSDPLVLLGAPLLLAALAMIACFIPARRSMQIDPLAALRQE